MVAKITLCDLEAGELCIVTFGTDILGNMIINFQLPDTDYPMFYVKASNKGNVNTYPCEVVAAISTSVYCSGVRTPLGEYIDIEVYATKGDVLIARGKFIVSALVRGISRSLIGTPIPTAASTSTPIGLNGVPTAPDTSTPILDIAYPNPTQTDVTPIPGTAYPNP